MRESAIVTAAALGALAVSGAWGEWVYEGQWGRHGSGNGEFVFVCDVDVAPNGTVYTAEFWDNGGRVQYFTPTGSYIGQWGLHDDDSALAVAPNTDVYVTFWGEVYYYTAQGSLKGSWGSYPHIYEILGIDIAANGNVYVSDGGNDKIQLFSAAGSKLREWGREGSGNGEFNNPAGIGVAPNGNVYVTDNGNARVQYFTAAGSFLGKWGSTGTGNGQFFGPKEVAVGPDGRVHVLEMYNNRVQYFTATGSFLGKFGRWGSGPSQFKTPYGLALSRDGRRLYVADMGNSRVQYFRWSPTNINPTSLGRVKALYH
ncbi:MAG: hypothetical protein JSU81_00955 [Candidatus Coatesbacteria bacterium]|nr:MAG: hypothetical protein JSU81_00955 [Candidatus Coatesbacteria bacterium]